MTLPDTTTLVLSMSLVRPSAFRHYVFGLACTVAGAGLTSLTGSLWPLAMGASVSVICTVNWVHAVRDAAARRRRA